MDGQEATPAAVGDALTAAATQAQQAPAVQPEQVQSQTQEAPPAEQDTQEQVEAGGKPSSYQARLAELERFRTEVNELRPQYETAQAKLAEMEARLGIFVDDPNWNPLPQIQALPEAYQDAVADAVIGEFLAPMVRQYVAKGAFTPEGDFGDDNVFHAVQSAIGEAIQGVYRRPVGEVDKIMQAFAGMSFPEVMNLAQRGPVATAPAPSTADPYATYGTAQPPSFNASGNLLLDYAQREGLDVTDPVAARVLTMGHNALQGAQQEIDRVRRAYTEDLAAVRKELAELKTGQTKRTEQEIATTASTREGQIYTEALRSVTEGRIPAGDTWTGRKIKGLAAELIQERPEIQKNLNLARDYLRKGATTQANSYYTLAQTAITRAYAEAAKQFVTENASAAQQQAQDDAARQAQARLTPGATPAGSTEVADIIAAAGPLANSPQRQAELMMQLAQRARGTQ